jgi:phosphomannomutase
LKSDSRAISGHEVCEVVRTDGLKLIFEDARGFLTDLSGAEPVVQVYLEARGKQGLEKLSGAAKQWIFE